MKNSKKNRTHDNHGFLGVFFGASNDSPTNIAGLIAVFLVLAGIINCLIGQISSEFLWEKITPILSMILGFLFGKKTQT